MTNKEMISGVIERLEYYQEWRRGGEGEHPNPNQLGKDLDKALRFIKKMLEEPSIGMSEAGEEVCYKAGSKGVYTDEDMVLKVMVKQALKELETEEGE